MSRTNFVFLLLLISISSIFTQVKFNATIATETSTNVKVRSSCDYCQTMACHCPSKEHLLNCSSYLLNLTFASNCADNKIWEIVDFSSRNLDFLDSSRLLSLRMHRLLLKSNLITHIHDHTFDSIGDVLIELDLETNQLSHLSPTWFNSKLIQLKKFNLASNQLESLLHLDDIHLPNLQELNLSCNQMSLFPNQIQQWTSLIKLDLSFNKLSSIPRLAFQDLHQLSWLSLASNRYLSCIIQDSFKYLKSLKYLDLSSTNLIDLDGCIFIQLTNLHILKIERVPINCSSCWLPIAEKNSIKLFGQCLSNITLQRLDSLTNEQIRYSCPKSSIDCSIDYCEPDAFDLKQKSDRSFNLLKDSNSSQNRTLQIVLGVVFSVIAIVILIIAIILIYRWRKGKKIFCCDFLPTTSSSSTTTTTGTKRRQRRQHQKQIIDNNPTMIESVVTHGTNMNVPSYSHQKDPYFNESTTNTKRKLYNPMFSDSPTSESRHHQTTMESNEYI